MKREEAIKSIKLFFQGLRVALSNETKEAFDTLIPELNESEEDERKYEYLYQIICNYINNPQIEYKERDKASKELIPFWERLKSLRLQPKIEWNEEDEIRLKEALEVLDESIKHLPIGYGYTRDVMYVKDWLKSLPERFNLQPKQQWSDEDEEKINSISEIIEHCITIPYSGGTLTLSKEHKKELQCFLKSLRPSLKPSEEQMEALRTAMDRNDSIGYHLGRLYEQLKKLM